MKRIFSLMLICLLLLSLCACEGKEEPESAGEQEGFEYIGKLNEALETVVTETESFENYTDKYEDALGDMGIILD